MQEGEWTTALSSSFTQAFLSASFSLMAGGFLFFALQAWINPRVRVWAEVGLLLPNMIPPLFLVLGMMNLVTPVMNFPYGLGAVIVAHVILNAGLVAIALDGLVQNRLGGMAETAWVLGSGRWMFWREVGWPYLRADLACLFLFVFSLCLTSFSIPLILGGERAGTLEVAIYDSIRMEGRWDKALMLAAFQSLVLFILAWMLPHPFWPSKPSRRGNLFFALPSLKIAVFVPAGLLAIGWLTGVLAGLKGLMSYDFMSSFTAAILTTVAVSLGVGLMHLLLFITIAYVSPNARLNRFLNGYLAPSPVITGFAFLLLPGEGDIWNILKLIVALTLILLPLLYRWIVHTELAALNGQIRVARTLGAPWWMIFGEIVWPQAAPQVMRACGLAALWASGDFALSSILAEDVETLPLIMEGLIGNYRMEAAQVLMLPLLTIGLGMYFLFVRMARYVAR
jgi:thiamine transport system permease protein